MFNLICWCKGHKLKTSYATNQHKQFRVQGQICLRCSYIQKYVIPLSFYSQKKSKEPRYLMKE